MRIENERIINTVPYTELNLKGIIDKYEDGIKFHEYYLKILLLLIIFKIN